MNVWMKVGIWVAVSVAAIVFGITLWCCSLLWKSPDYAAVGSCTGVEIDKTYVEIGKAQAFRNASMTRVHYEFWAFHPHVRTLRGALERSANSYAYEIFGKRKTAAYQCNHAKRHVNGVTANTLPQLVALLQPYEAEEGRRWRLALCMTDRARNIETKSGRGGFDQLKRGCAQWPPKPWQSRRR